MRALIGAVLLLLGSGCPSTQPPPPTTTRYDQFALDPATVVLRPYACAQVQLLVKSTPVTPPSAIEWSFTGVLEHRSLADIEGSASGATQSVVEVCAGGDTGRFTMKAGLKDRPDYYADGTIEVSTPEPKDVGLNPLDELQGSPVGPVVRLWWEADGGAFFAVGRDQTLSRWDGTTLTPKGGWVTFSRDAIPLSDGRWFTNVRGVYGAIYSPATRTFDTWFRAQGQDPSDRFDVDLFQTLSTDTTEAIGAGGGRIASWVFNDDQNAEACTLGALHLATNRRTQVAWELGRSRSGRAAELGVTGTTAGPLNTPTSFPPELYAELSPNGRYFAFGPGGCITGNSLYDFETDRFSECGNDDRNNALPRAQFSGDSSALLKTSRDSAQHFEIFETPSCATRTRGDFNGDYQHLGMALSHDGRKLAVASDFIDSQTNETVLRLSLYDVGPGAPATFTAGDVSRSLTVRAPPHYAANEVNVNDLHRLAFSPDGTRLAWAMPDGQLALVELSKPDADAVKWNEQPTPGLVLDASLSPNGRYLALTQNNSGTGIGNQIYDLQTKKVVLHLESYELKYLGDDGVVVFDTGSTRQHFEIAYATPTVRTPTTTVPPTIPPTPGPCVLRNEGKEICHLGATERCATLATLSGGSITVGLTTIWARSACAIATTDGLPSLWQWAPGSNVISRATHFANGRPGPRIDQGGYRLRMLPLPDGRIVIPTQRLEFWRP